jgi:hypothetical protein
MTTQDALTFAFAAIAACATFGLGLFTYLYRQANDELEESAIRYNSLNEVVDEQAKEIEAANDAIDHLRLEKRTIENVSKRWEELAAGRKVDYDRLLTERATLYLRNALGQIEPITPKPSKPHTLKHGMTVKDPSAYNAKRIFREAKKAGIDWDNVPPVEDDKMSLDIIFWEYEWNGEKESVVAPRPNSYEVTTYISATEFIRRIKGEIE